MNRRFVADVRMSGYPWCERCRKPMYHGHYVYSHCCKGCIHFGVCDSDCVSLRMVALSRSEWLGGRLELYRHPDNGRYWICKAKTCDGCVIPWLYVDTLLKSNGRATDQMQLESNGPASSEWLRRELEMYYDQIKESLWIWPAESSYCSGMDERWDRHLLSL